MPLVTLKELLTHAHANKYAVGSLNVWDMLSARNVVAAAERMKAPMILSVWKNELEFVGEKALYDICLDLGRKSSVPIAVFIDHATDIEAIEHAIELGATSVMIDGSHLPLEENIALTRRAVEMAHAAGISCEGELGVLGEEDGNGEVSDLYTNAEEAARFAAETGVDALAVAIGNAHGFYKLEPKLDFARLEEIANGVEVPLVLHGGTGISDEDVQRAIGMGIAKVNIGSEGRKAYMDGIRQALEADKEEVFYHKLLPLANEMHQALVEEKIKMMLSDEKAW